jgi:glutamate-1-semialdehyde 2,1-aminomutase
MAVLIARAATGRNKVIAIEDGYHGSSPWMQAIDRAGIKENDHANIIRIPWNDVQALEQALTENATQVAAFISSPYHHPAYKDNVLPHEIYWQEVQALLKSNGVVSILDDVRAGFRIDMAGSNNYFGFKPDMICYCKAIANGYPISALVGADSLADAAGAIFQTGSFWFSAAPMAAALACLKELQRSNAPHLIMNKGKKVTEGLKKIAADQGNELVVSGMPSMPYLRTEHEAGIEFHQALCGECTRRGVFLASHHNLFISAALSDEDIQQTWNIFEIALTVVNERFKG